MSSLRGSPLAIVREIAARAGVGIATVYRHFPQRSDLVAAVFRREVEHAPRRLPRWRASINP